MTLCLVGYCKTLCNAPGAIEGKLTSMQSPNAKANCKPKHPNMPNTKRRTHLGPRLPQTATTPSSSKIEPVGWAPGRV